MGPQEAFHSVHRLPPARRGGGVSSSSCPTLTPRLDLSLLPRGGSWAQPLLLQVPLESQAGLCPGLAPTLNSPWGGIPHSYPGPPLGCPVVQLTSWSQHLRRGRWLCRDHHLLWGPTRSLTRAFPSYLASGVCWCPLLSCDKTCFTSNVSRSREQHQCPGHIRTDTTGQSPTPPARWSLKTRPCGWSRSSST